MTDDERMDRARRIREMREGSRPDDEAQAPDDPDSGGESQDGTDDDDASATVADDDASAPDAEGTDATDDAVDAVENGESEAADAAANEDVAGDDAADDTAADDAAEAADDDAGGTMHIPGAEVGDVEVDVAEMARQAGLESAAAGADGEGDASADPTAAGVTGAAARAEGDDADAGDETRVLEFTLGDEQYCLDIEYVEEIVKRETVTRVPNTPDCVEGVVDLRGQITTILDPKVLLDIGTRGSKDLIVVFDPEQFDDQGAVGWVVDDVDRVTPVAEDEVNSSPVDQDHVNGVVDRDGEFVIWTTPELDVEEMAG